TLDYLYVVGLYTEHPRNHRAQYCVRSSSHLGNSSMHGNRALPIQLACHYRPAASRAPFAHRQTASDTTFFCFLPTDRGRASFENLDRPNMTQNAAQGRLITVAQQIPLTKLH